MRDRKARQAAAAGDKQANGHAGRDERLAACFGLPVMTCLRVSRVGGPGQTTPQLFSFRPGRQPG